MASCPFSFPISINPRQQNSRAPPPICSCSTATANSVTFSFPSCLYSKINLHNLVSFKRNSWRGRCLATGPQSEPPSGKNLSPSSGVTAAFTRFRDTLQIFFAVLFWMSLFFWSSAWGGRDGGRRNKGSRFRK